jgi:glycosyltransferase involved in cell wall biosynthesis
MITAPLVSVLVPTCFREAILLECIDSLVTQDYPQFEILVVDQADDRSLEGVLRQRYSNDSRLRYLHLPRAGAARARNLGLENALGSIAAFIDDDAVASPGWIKGHVAALSTEPCPALVAGRIYPIWPGARPAWFPQDREFLLGLYDLGGGQVPLPSADLPIAANMAGHRDIILAHGGFDENLGFNYFRRSNMSGGEEADIEGGIRDGGHALVHRRKTMIGGEEALLGRRIRKSGYSFVYAPAATVHHRVSPHKATRRYLLKRHFWEGVSVAKQLGVLGQLGANRLAHYRFHSREIAMATGRFFLPGFHNDYPGPKAAVRMASLSRIAYALGVIYAVSEQGTPQAIATEKVKCASG